MELLVGRFADTGARRVGFAAHEAAAELEVSTLASGFRGHEQAWTIVISEAGDLGVALRRGQSLVEDAGREMRPNWDERKFFSWILATPKTGG